MIDIYLKPDGLLERNVDEKTLKSRNINDILWVDVCSPTKGEEEAIKELIDVKLVTPDEAQEIESTSKYCETEDAIVSNINFYEEDQDDFKVETISFILTNSNILVSVRHSDCNVFAETARRFNIDRSHKPNGVDLFLTMIESHIDREADIMELIAGKITRLSMSITGDEKVGKETITDISILQSKIITFRENIFDLQRVLFSIRRSSRFERNLQPRLQLMLQDVDSLINHADFSFQRLDSVQDTALGLINIEQNEIMKILSIAAVVFMPPTLVASIYGMNFKYMPELDWAYTTSSGLVIPLGFLFAILIMVVISILTLLFCKFKKWL